jgi:streptogramin lyase
MGTAPAVAAAVIGDITEFSDGLFHDNGPQSIVPGPDGNLWFTNPGNEDSISRITTDGAVTEFKIGIDGFFMESIARGPEGNLWYTDPTKSINRFTPTGGLTPFTNGPRLELRPFSIARGADENLWFTVQGGEPRAIGRITPTGEITEYLAGLNPGSFPYGIAPGPDGNIWFADDGMTPAIGRITPSGQITEFTAGLSPGSVVTRIAPGPDGNLWFTNLGAQSIGRITPSGEITEFTEGLGPNSRPWGITPGPDGNLWFTDRGSVSSTRAIGRITPTGQITEWRTGLNENNFLEQITSGEDGNVWFTDSGFTPAIGRILTGQPPAVQQSPLLEGTAEVGGTLACSGEQWATWGVGAPVPNSSSQAPPGVQWLRDGTPIPGATARNYELTPADRGHSVGCTVVATYPLVDVVATAMSDVAALPPPDPEPPVKPEEPPSSNPEVLGPPPLSPSPMKPAPVFTGVSPTLRCKMASKKTLCTLSLTSLDPVSWLRLSRHGVTYAQGTPVTRGQRLVLRFRTPQPLRQGRYALTITRRVNFTTPITRQSVPFDG